MILYSRTLITTKKKEMTIKIRISWCLVFSVRAQPSEFSIISWPEGKRFLCAWSAGEGGAFRVFFHILLLASMGMAHGHKRFIPCLLGSWFPWGEYNQSYVWPICQQNPNHVPFRQRLDPHRHRSLSHSSRRLRLRKSIDNSA